MSYPERVIQGGFVGDNKKAGRYLSAHQVLLSLCAVQLDGRRPPVDTEFTLDIAGVDLISDRRGDKLECNYSRIEQLHSGCFYFAGSEAIADESIADGLKPFTISNTAKTISCTAIGSHKTSNELVPKNSGT